MSTARIAVLAAALAVAPACAGAQYDQPPPGWGDTAYQQSQAPGDYDAALSPHGMWATDAQYGRIWHPAVDVGWQPYVDGYWAWSPYGWTWISSEPWAWTFHYGRWVYVPAFGWSWVPGYTWGPAWVDWYWGDGFVGWAPLSPFGVHVASYNSFVFVHEGDFCSRRLRPFAFDHRRLPRRIVRDWGRRGFHAPDHDRIERISRHPITRIDHRPAGTLAPRRDGHRLARPDVSPRLGGARADQLRRGFARDDSTREIQPGLRDRTPRLGAPRDGREVRLARPRVEPVLRPPTPVLPRRADPAPGWSRPHDRQLVAPRGAGGARGWARPVQPVMPSPGLTGARRSSGGAGHAEGTVRAPQSGRSGSASSSAGRGGGHGLVRPGGSVGLPGGGLR
jgi:hypothetical protein